MNNDNRMCSISILEVNRLTKVIDDLREKNEHLHKDLDKAFEVIDGQLSVIEMLFKRLNELECKNVNHANTEACRQLHSLTATQARTRH